MKKFKVAGLSAENKTALNSARERVFVPEEFRSLISVGSWALTTVEHFDQSNVYNEETQEWELVDQPFDRTSVCFVGDYASIVEELNADVIMEGVDEIIIKTAQTKAAKSYGAVAVTADDLAGN